MLQITHDIHALSLLETLGVILGEVSPRLERAGSGTRDISTKITHAEAGVG